MNTIKIAASQTVHIIIYHKTVFRVVSTCATNSIDSMTPDLVVA